MRGRRCIGGAPYLAFQHCALPVQHALHPGEVQTVGPVAVNASVILVYISFYIVGTHETIVVPETYFNAIVRHIHEVTALARAAVGKCEQRNQDKRDGCADKVFQVLFHRFSSISAMGSTNLSMFPAPKVTRTSRGSFSRYCISSSFFRRTFSGAVTSLKMIPAWRPDKAMNVEKPEFAAYVKQLAEVADIEIKTFKDMVDALQRRHDFFHENGCRLSDHGIEEFYDEPYTDSQIEIIFEKAMRGQQFIDTEVRQFKHCFLTLMAEMDYESNWTQQYHYGAIRDNNSLMYDKLGPDTGFDSIGEFNTARAMSHFLNHLNAEGKLTRTILYTLNPCANEVIATMLGNFQDGSCPGKIQFGSGWWFNDQLDGMTRQMNALSVLGLLSRFVGMLTDSRSFLSYPRHEYFRRLLCNLLGNDVENGLLPDDMESLARMVKDISYYNAKNYFKFY